MGKSAEQILRYTSDEIEVPEEPSASRELSFGQYLRRERILRGISREDIVTSTKVSLEYYDSLENNQFDRLPQRPFVVGFLRALSRYAGLNGDEVVNRFLAELAEQEAFEEVTQADGTFLRRNLRTVLAVCAVVCMLLLMFAPLFRHV